MDLNGNIIHEHQSLILDKLPNLESLSLCHNAGFLSRLISSKIAYTRSSIESWQDDRVTAAQNDRTTGCKDERMLSRIACTKSTMVLQLLLQQSKQKVDSNWWESQCCACCATSSCKPGWAADCLSHFHLGWGEVSRVLVEQLAAAQVRKAKEQLENLTLFQIFCLSSFFNFCWFLLKFVRVLKHLLPLKFQAKFEFALWISFDNDIEGNHKGIYPNKSTETELREIVNLNIAVGCVKYFRKVITRQKTFEFPQPSLPSHASLLG